MTSKLTLLRAKKSNENIVDRSVDRVQRWWPIMTGVYAAALTAYTSTTKLLVGFSLIDALLVGFVGALTLTALTLVCFAQYRRIRPKLPPVRDRDQFVEEIVTVADLIGDGAPLLSHKVFKRCIIRGPGQIKFQSQVESLFCAIERRNIVVLPEGSNIMGAVIAVRCVFIECYFDNLAIVGTPQDIAHVNGAFEVMPLSDWMQKYAK